MYTEEELVFASARSKYFRSKGMPVKGILTSDEARQRADHVKTLVTVSSDKHKVFFFADEHTFGYPVLPNDFVPCTARFPIQVVARESLPTGEITTIDDYINVFEKDRKQIVNIQELLDLLNSETIL